MGAMSETSPKSKNLIKCFKIYLYLTWPPLAAMSEMSPKSYKMFLYLTRPPLAATLEMSLKSKNSIRIINSFITL